MLWLFEERSMGLFSCCGKNRSEEKMRLVQKLRIPSSDEILSYLRGVMALLLLALEIITPEPLDSHFSESGGK